MKSASEWIEKAKGQGLTSIAKQGFGGWLLALFGAVITGMQSVLSLLLTPVRLLGDLARASIGAFFLEPLGIIEAGATASAQGAAQFGIFGLLVAVGIVLASFWLVIQYIQEAETTALPIPGFIIEPIPFVGAEEEADPQD